MRTPNDVLHTVVISVCNGCYTRQPGHCNVPGCVYCRWPIEDVPELMYQCVTVDQYLGEREVGTEKGLHRDDRSNNVADPPGNGH